MAACHTTDENTITHTDACRDECYDGPDDEKDDDR